MGDFPIQQRPQMSLTEFRDEGYLLEVNRRVLHPLGLALGFIVPDPGDDKEPQLVVWDGRDDPTGVRFGNWDETRQDKVAHIADLEERLRPVREAALGYFIEPVDPC